MKPLSFYDRLETRQRSLEIKGAERRVEPEASDTFLAFLAAFLFTSFVFALIAWASS